MFDYEHQNNSSLTPDFGIIPIWSKSTEMLRWLAHFKEPQLWLNSCRNTSKSISCYCPWPISKMTIKTTTASTRTQTKTFSLGLITTPTLTWTTSVHNNNSNFNVNNIGNNKIRQQQQQQQQLKAETSKWYFSDSKCLKMSSQFPSSSMHLWTA